MNPATHEAKREEIADSELAKHQGKWVAFHSTGHRIIASSETLDSLRRELLSVGEDPNQVVLTHLPIDTEGMPLGGLEIE